MQIRGNGTYKKYNSYPRPTHVSNLVLSLNPEEKIKIEDFTYSLFDRTYNEALKTLEKEGNVKDGIRVSKYVIETRYGCKSFMTPSVD